MNDLTKAYLKLTDKARPYTDLWKYFDGDHPIVYTAQRLRQIFNRIDARFSENWCEVVVSAVLDRLDLQRFEVKGSDEATKRLNEIWQETGMDLDANSAHTAALVTGEAFVVVWKNDATGELEAFYHDPRQCHIFYDPQNPRRKAFAVKQWVDEDNLLRYNLYYPDRIEYYRSSKRADGVQRAEDLRPMNPASGPNPYGEVPVFHLRPETRATKGELANILEPQDAVNKLLCDMMVAAEFGAMAQRYVISNADVATLQNGPGQIWDVPQGASQDHPSQVGQFDATPLRNFLDAIDHVVRSIAIISRTPKHFFFQQGGDPSGEALIAMEAPLNRKVQRRIRHFSAGWRDVARFLLVLDGFGNVMPSTITPVFDEAETIQPLTQAQIRQTAVSTGIPLKTALRREGWTDAEIAAMEKDKEAERQETEANLAASMVRAQRSFDRGGSGA
jgi:hypothetical protein